MKFFKDFPEFNETTTYERYCIQLPSNLPNIILMVGGGLVFLAVFCALAIAIQKAYDACQQRDYIEIPDNLRIGDIQTFVHAQNNSYQA